MMESISASARADWIVRWALALAGSRLTSSLRGPSLSVRGGGGESHQIRPKMTATAKMGITTKAMISAPTTSGLFFEAIGTFLREELRGAASSLSVANGSASGASSATGGATGGVSAVLSVPEDG